MKREEKEILLKDLCCRLSYGVKLWHESFEDVITLHAIDATQFAVNISIDNSNDNTSFWNSIEQVKPYLFPMSSMTEEQRNEYHELLYNPKYGINIDYFDWCHKNHLDCRGLIKKGSANDATGLNIY